MCTLTDETLDSELVCDSVREGGLLDLDHVSFPSWLREIASSSEVSAGVSVPVSEPNGEGPKDRVRWGAGDLIGKDVIRLLKMLTACWSPASVRLRLRLCENAEANAWCMSDIVCRLKSRGRCSWTGTVWLLRLLIHQEFQARSRQSPKKAVTSFRKAREAIKLEFCRKTSDRETNTVGSTT